MYFKEWFYQKRWDEGVNDSSKIVSIEDKIHQYKELAFDYFSSAENNVNNGNSVVFLYLHAIELLFKGKYLEEIGPMDIQLEKSHDLNQFMDALRIPNKYRVLSQLDPNMTKFRYPGVDYKKDSDVASVRSLAKELWELLT